MSCKRMKLVHQIMISFIVGIALGLLAKQCMPEEYLRSLISFVSPFGNIMVAMLKMVVYPVIFFSLVLGAASLPLKKSGKVGLSVILWYTFTSLFAAIFGVVLAKILNPSISNASELVNANMSAVEAMSGNSAGTIADFLVGLFQNPFGALSSGQFLPIIVFSIIFGFAARCILDDEKKSSQHKVVQALLDMMDGAQAASFKMIEWVMFYFPIGVFALTFCNFAQHGTLLFGPYIRIVVCVLLGICFMIFGIYPLLICLFCHENPYRAMSRMRQAILTAFITRSSAATLPVSFSVMQQLGVKQSLSSFSLPLGATINMDGVCIHLPVFVILATNMFNIDLSFTQLFIVVISIMFASVGAGGVPGGSIFLLFMVLENIGLAPNDVNMIIALALGINPILDMFETCCNVTGDNVCTYIIAKNYNLIDDSHVK